MDELNTNSAAGPDVSSAILLKPYKQLIAKSLKSMFQDFLESRKFSNKPN